MWTELTSTRLAAAHSNLASGVCLRRNTRDLYLLSCMHRLPPIRLYLRTYIHVANVTRLYLVHCLDTRCAICDRYTFCNYS
jgi:hypothetical protein